MTVLLLPCVACESVTCPQCHSPIRPRMTTLSHFRIKFWAHHTRPIPKGNSHPRLRRRPPIVGFVRSGCLESRGHRSNSLDSSRTPNHVIKVLPFRMSRARLLDSGLAIYSPTLRSSNPNCIRRAKIITSCLLCEVASLLGVVRLLRFSFVCAGGTSS